MDSCLNPLVHCGGCLDGVVVGLVELIAGDEGVPVDDVLEEVVVILVYIENYRIDQQKKS